MMLLGGTGVGGGAPLPSADVVVGGVQIIGDAAFQGESISCLVAVGLWGGPLIGMLSKGGAGGFGGSPLMMGAVCCRFIAGVRANTAFLGVVGGADQAQKVVAMGGGGGNIKGG
eukprot:4755277-Amphidinium_carterae.1